MADRFRKNNTWWVPTLNVDLAPQNRDKNDPRNPGPASPSWAIAASFRKFTAKVLADSVPRDYGTRFLEPGGPTDSLGFLHIVRRVGLPILAGSDAEPWIGFSLHAELAIYVAEGLTPLEALQTATLNPAKMLRATDSLGTVAPGKLADLVLLDANPLADITNTTTIRAVVANGHYFDRTALDRLLGEVQQRTEELEARVLDSLGTP